MRRNYDLLQGKIRESLVSVLPITAIVVLLVFSIVPVTNDILMSFIIGAIMLILGMGLFTLGADMAMSPLGEHIGAAMTRKRNIAYIVFGSFIMGFFISISEPDLKVLASQVPQLKDITLIVAVSIGVGVFLVIGILRTLFGVRLSYLLIGCYIVVFILSIFVPKDFLSIAFDSGGVTTGPMTVPFIMALGVGVASIRSDRHAQNDSFGLVALCSVGPIIAVMILGIIFPVEGAAPEAAIIPAAADSKELLWQFTHQIPEYVKDVGMSLLPIGAMFAFFQITELKLPKREVLKMVIGLAYTYVGLVLFLTGVNVGFMPVGRLIGGALATLDYKWILIPIGMIMGYFVVEAEPAVHVLNKQVEEVTSGAIPGKALSTTLSIGVAISVGLSMIRVLTGISIYWILIPGYAIALILALIVPRIFTSIAFDSGGVASGPMTATFMLPFAMGASEAVGGNVVTDAFGLVALVAMTPLITIQILGLVYKYKTKHEKPDEELENDEIFELDDGEITELGDTPVGRLAQQSESEV